MLFSKTKQYLKPNLCYFLLESEKMDSEKYQNNIQIDKDHNDLNECSRLFAQYFFCIQIGLYLSLVNNEEISLIKKLYNCIVSYVSFQLYVYSEKEPFEKTLATVLNTKQYQLYDLLFKNNSISLRLVKYRYIHSRLEYFLLLYYDHVIQSNARPFLLYFTCLISHQS